MHLYYFHRINSHQPCVVSLRLPPSCNCLPCVWPPAHLHPWLSQGWDIWLEKAVPVIWISLSVLLKFYRFILRMQLKRKLHSYTVLSYACSLQKSPYKKFKSLKKNLINRTGTLRRDFNTFPHPIFYSKLYIMWTPCPIVFFISPFSCSVSSTNRPFEGVLSRRKGSQQRWAGTLAQYQKWSRVMQTPQEGFNIRTENKHLQTSIFPYSLALMSLEQVKFLRSHTPWTGSRSWNTDCIKPLTSFLKIVQLLYLITVLLTPAS